MSNDKCAFSENSSKYLHASVEYLQNQLEDIQRELQRRQKINLERPKINPNPDLTALKSLTEETINNIIETGFPGKDHRHFIYEKVMEALYGSQVWDWLNKYSQD